MKSKDKTIKEYLAQISRDIDTAKTIAHYANDHFIALENRLSALEAAVKNISIEPEIVLFRARGSK